MHGFKKKPAEGPSWTLGGADGSLVDVTYCKSRIRITGFGRCYDGHDNIDWTFRPLKKFEDGKKDLLSVQLLPKIAAARGIKEILAPHPEFGTNVCAINDLRVRIPLKGNGTGVVLLRGATADIAMLGPGETFAISVGGCPVGWMFDPERPRRLLVAHMGLKCLIDRQLVVTGQKSRHHRSVIDRMWESMHLLPRDAKRMHVGFAFPIHPLENKHEWNFPKDGAENKLICEHLVRSLHEECVYGWADVEARQLGRIHLGNVIRRQYMALGIPKGNIHGMSAPDGLGTDSHPLWYTTRGPHGQDPRNLVLVTLNV